MDTFWIAVHWKSHRTNNKFEGTRSRVWSAHGEFFGISLLRSIIKSLIALPFTTYGFHNMEDHCEPVKKTTTTTEKYDNICTFEHEQCFIFVFILNYIDFGWLFVAFMSHICPNRVRSQHITRSLLSFFGHIIIGVVTSLFFTVYCFFRFIDHFYCYYTCLAVTIKELMALQSCCSAPDIIQ